MKNGLFSFFYILQLPHTVISNSEKLTHPTVYSIWMGVKDIKEGYVMNGVEIESCCGREKCTLT